MKEQKHPGQKEPRTLRCEEWEALLPDALDGLLPAHDLAAFEAHSAGCNACAELLTQTKQGREWLEYLHGDPEVPADLIGKILNRTTGAEGVPIVVAAGPQLVAPHAVAIPLRRSFYEARLLMTAAMAFFSIALTLNLAGVRLSNIRLADLRPSVIQSTLSRQFYGAKEQVVRYYDNLRFVYQVESKVKELRRDAQEQPVAPQPKSNKDGSGKAGHSQNRNGQMHGAPHDMVPVSSRGGVQMVGMSAAGTRAAAKRLLCIEAAGRVHGMRERKEQRSIRKMLEVGPLVVIRDDRAGNCPGGHMSSAGTPERSLA